VTWNNTEMSYGRMARWLHWAVAGLFALSYGSVYYRHWFTEERDPAWLFTGNLHRCIGISVAVFFILRIAWRLNSPRPRPLPGPYWRLAAARAVQGALFGLMIFMPLTGYLGTGAPTDFGLFAVPSFADSGLFLWLSGGTMSFEEWEAPLDYVHKEILGAWLVWILVAVHAGAALYHHFRLRDETLARMLGRQR